MPRATFIPLNLYSLGQRTCKFAQLFIRTGLNSVLNSGAHTNETQLSLRNLDGQLEQQSALVSSVCATFAKFVFFSHTVLTHC